MIRRKKNQNHYAGIDPGKQGWIVVINKDGKLVRDWPIPYLISEIDTIALSAIFDSMSGLGTALIVLEKQQPFSKEGSVSSFTTGGGYMALKMGIACYKLRLEVMSPKAWKKLIGLPSVSSKSFKAPKKPPRGSTRSIKDNYQRDMAVIEKKRRAASAEAKKRGKELSKRRAQELAPIVDFRKSSRCRTAHDGKCEAFLMAEVARRIDRGIHGH